MTKQELRKEIRERRAALTTDYMAEADSEILTRLLTHPMFHQAESIFCYVNMPGEPSTREILETAFQMGKMVTVPRCIPGTHEMEAVQIESMEDLVPGMMGILEPKQGLPVVDGFRIDLAIIPCLSADARGGRLGHGAGYYDRFLHGLSIQKYCLCYEELLSEEIPMEAEDIRMDRVFTERKCYNPRFYSEDAGESIRRESGEGICGLLKSFFSKKSS